MKIGDVVRHKEDGDIGVIVNIDGIHADSNPELYEIMWVLDGLYPLQCYGINGHNLEVIDASG